MPENHICIFDIFIAVLSNPLRKTLRGLAGCLRYVTPCRIDLVVAVYRSLLKDGKKGFITQLTFGYVDCMSRKSGPLPN